MLTGDDFDVNSAETLPVSLKQTMMSQDLLFRTQVCELHRLYAVQKNLMNDFENTYFDELNMSIQDPESTMMLLSSRNNINCISASLASSATSALGDLTKDRTLMFLPKKMQSGIVPAADSRQKLLFGFQLPTDEFVSGSEVGRHGSEKRDCFGNHVINHNNRRHHTGDKRKFRSFPDNVIELESSNVCDGDIDKVEIPHQSLPWFLRMDKDKLNHGLQDFSQLQASGGRVLDLDLNVAQLDSLSNSSSTSDVLEPNGANERLIQEEGTCVKRTSYSEGINSGRGRVVDIDLECVPESSSPTDAGKENCSSTAHDLRNESVGSSLKEGPHDHHHLCERHGIDLAGPDNESEERASKKLCKKSSASIESEITADNNHSSGLECGGDSNLSSSNDVQKGELLLQPQHNDNVSTEQEQRSSESTDSNNQLHNNNDKEEVADELDEWVQSAAAALVGLSLDSSSSFDLSGLENKKQNEVDDDVPRFLVDSYERMVLGIEESSPEDLTALSKKFEVSEPGKESVYKLKRGTRMKNFLKDILPSLSTLARREISEDINTMDGVIRSREYKKMRLKMGNATAAASNDRGKQSRRRRGRR